MNPDQTMHFRTSSFRRALLAAVILVVAAADVAAAQRCSGPRRRGDRDNLGTCVNSRIDDILPYISPDGRTLYLSRKNSPENVGGTADDGDVWVSELQADSTWGAARNIGAPPNTRHADFVTTALPDGNTLLLSGDYRPDGTKQRGVSLITRTRDGWSAPAALTLRGVENRSQNIAWYLSQDGLHLLMSIDKNGTRGARDLWVSHNNGGTWGEPVNLGATINTDTTETTPFLASDGVTLYFGSYGHGGRGGMDVFMTRRLDDTWTRWSPPENLGPRVNTREFDAGLVVDAAGEFGYLASTQNARNGADIFRVRIPENMRPRPVVLVRGRVLDARTQQPLGAEVFYEGLGNDQRGIARSNPVTGEYQIVLPAGARFGFRGQAPRYYPESVNVDLSDVTAYAERTQDLRLIPLAVGSTVRLNNIFFETGQAVLRAESALELDRLVAYLQANRTVQIEVGGHTDNVGADATNQTLSQARARAVAAYLTGKGIPATRVQARGYGETQPGATNDTDEGRQQNRRVEFKVIRI